MGQWAAAAFLRLKKPEPDEVGQAFEDPVRMESEWTEAQVDEESHLASLRREANHSITNGWDCTPLGRAGQDRLYSCPRG